MKTTQLRFFCLSLLMHGAVSNAEVLTKVSVVTQNETTNYTMYNTGKMFFSDENLVIDTIGYGDRATTQLALIKKVLFSTIERDQNGSQRLISDASALDVYPTVADDAIYVKGVSGSFAYKIFAATGSLVKQGECVAGNSINVETLGKGVYFIQINGSILKFVKA